MSEEIWTLFAEQPDYAVSSFGRVKRISPNAQGWGVGRIIKPRMGNSGYLYVDLGPTGKRTRYQIHRLVLRAFIGEPPSETHWGAHNDGRRLNNVLENLRWSTPKENQADKRLHGTHLEGEKAPWSKITAAQVTDIRTRWANGGITQSALGKEYGVGQGHIWRIVHNKRWVSNGS